MAVRALLLALAVALAACGGSDTVDFSAPSGGGAGAVGSDRVDATLAPAADEVEAFLAASQSVLAEVPARG